MTENTPATTGDGKQALVVKIDPKAPMGNENNVVELLKSYRKAFERVAPKHLDLNRMMRIALMTVSRSQSLLGCTGSSLLGAFMLSAQMGLDIAAREAHLVPFKNSKTNQKEVQLVPDYRGIIKLVRNSGQVANMRARIVYKDDHFIYQEGMDPKLEHTPNFDVPLEDKNIIGAYSIADFCDNNRVPTGFKDAHFVTVAYLRKVRDKSPAGRNGPWVDHFAEMCLKTVIKHHAKTLPYSVELATALELDARVEMLKPQNIQITDGAELTAAEVVPEDDEDRNAGNGDLTQQQQKPTGSKLDTIVDAIKKANETKPHKPAEAITGQKQTESPKPETKLTTTDAGEGEQDQDQLRVIEPESLLTPAQKDFLEAIRNDKGIDPNAWISWARKKFDVKMASKILQKHFADAKAWHLAGGKEPA